MYRRNTPWNHINHSEEISFEISEDILEDGCARRINVMLLKLTETTRPMARIKSIRIDLRMEPEDWRQKRGDEYWTGQTLGFPEGKTPRYILITKHQDTKEEEEDLGDEFKLGIEAADAKTVGIPANGEVSGSLKGTGK
jgi:hypothetical protein